MARVTSRARMRPPFNQDLIFVAVVELVVGLDPSVLIGLCVPHVRVLIAEVVVQARVHRNRSGHILKRQTQVNARQRKICRAKQPDFWGLFDCFLIGF